ncbi:uncharacterized protein LOC110105425 [Dendrobium catenatum]|uniref:uncharacterized protein LOC110105425 n=1 Tax=Dendrobium catenatum TaxID=906689 RepID=UPI0009F481ED|nr:uncharacterized protein LOC110105425 [Dendrobium catenatum]
MEGSSLTVDNFLKDGVWVTFKLKEFFENDLINLITSIDIRNGEDSLELMYNLSGIEGANQPPRLLNSWLSPPSDWIKVNIDAAFHNSYKASIGGVFRDHYGRFLLDFGKPLTHWDAVVVELQVILAIKLVIKEWMLHYKGLIIEGDNMNVINFIKEMVKKGGNDSIDLSFIKDFDFVVFKCVDRGSNKLANLCANFACFSSFIWNNVTLSDIPPSFITLLEEESDNYRK